MNKSYKGPVVQLAMLSIVAAAAVGCSKDAEPSASAVVDGGAALANSARTPANAGGTGTGASTGTAGAVTAAPVGDVTTPPVGDVTTPPGELDGSVEVADASPVDAGPIDAGVVLAADRKLRIFGTSGGHNGDFRSLIAGSTTGSGIPGADKFCNDGAPSGIGSVKALIGGSDRSPTKDWPLQASREYFNSDGTKSIGTTTAAAALPSTLSVAIFPSGGEAWTGWSSGANSCSDWTRGTGAAPYAAVGESLSTSLATLSFKYLQFCDRGNVKLICVEQP